jgi:hypothetical protein
LLGSPGKLTFGFLQASKTAITGVHVVVEVPHLNGVRSDHATELIGDCGLDLSDDMGR